MSGHGQGLGFRLLREGVQLPAPSLALAVRPPRSASVLSRCVSSGLDRWEFLLLKTVGISSDAFSTSVEMTFASYSSTH